MCIRDRIKTLIENKKLSFGGLWNSDSPFDGMKICHLTDCIQRLADKPNFLNFFDDEFLKKGKHESSVETLKAAALFERRRSGSVLEFEREQGGPSGVGSRADFLVELDGARVPVECKFLRKSESQITFSDKSSGVVSAVSKHLSNLDPRGRYIELTLIQRDIFSSTIDLRHAKEMLEIAIGWDSNERELILDAPSCWGIVNKRKPNEHLSWEVQIRVAALQSKKEDERIRKMVVQANRQLRSGGPGICFISGYSEVHDWRAIGKHLQKEFRAGNFRSVDRVFLHADGVGSNDEFGLYHCHSMCEITRSTVTPDFNPPYLYAFYSAGPMKEHNYKPGYIPLYLGDASTSCQIGDSPRPDEWQGAFLSTGSLFVREDLFA